MVTWPVAFGLKIMMEVVQRESVHFVETSKQREGPVVF